MLNTLVSQQLNLPMLPENQLSQINSGINGANSSTPSNLTEAVDSLGSNPTAQQSPLLRMQHHAMDSATSGISAGHVMLTSSNLNVQSELMQSNTELQHSAKPANQTGQTQVSRPYLGQMNSSMPNKRKATIELLADNQAPQKMSAPTRRGAQVGLSGKSPISGASVTNSWRSNASGKVVQVDSVKNKPQSSGSKKINQPQMPSKTSTESNESMRAKLRESLASALALVSQEKETSSDGNLKTETESTATNQKGVQEDKDSASVPSKDLGLVPGNAEEASTSGASCPIDNSKSAQGVRFKEICEDSSQTWNYMESDFQSNPVLSGEDVSFGNGFFFKDELLQGNGLSWAADFGPHAPEVYSHSEEGKRLEQTKKPELIDEELSGHEQKQTVQSPESVAFSIESELFKLFGGVNKKYKEKARSLLFNLKDPNNPELRERVMSGEISPGRLCSMTAEELASKELSQWRIAKAEELDHMKVLPDSDANMRRLVKKTHKGEYQVDLEPDVGAAEEMPMGTSAPFRNQSKAKGADAGTLPKPSQTKTDQGDLCEITIPSDGTDMQGLMVDDVRDLPPIMSLDEFMESLDKEPPFEDLPVGSARESDKELELDSESMPLAQPPENSLNNTSDGTNSISPEQSSKHPEDKMSPGANSLSPLLSSKRPLQATSQRTESMSPVMPSKHLVDSISHKTNGVSVESLKPDSGMKSSAQKGVNEKAVVHLPKGERVWEGSLQLNISSMADFIAFYKSGEKAKTRDWSGLFDIKGRVKLEAFDQFVQALPMSRSRAVMVTHFVLKEGSSDSDHANLQEVVDSYVTDQRLGFAEPTSGVELYLCAPRTKSVDVIIKHLPKSFTDKLNDIDNGLIGLVVWRKVQYTPPAISPNSSSHHHHHKDTSMTKKIGGHNVKNDLKGNVGFAPRLAPPPPVVSHSQPNDDENDDDAPPGFGPPSHERRDDDDLPEFNFSGGSNPPVPRLPHVRPGAPTPKAVKMRELIQRYGQNGGSISGVIPTQPWNDDDDDIPEWQPQAPPSPRPTQHVPNPVLPPHVATQLPHHMPPQHSVWPPQQLQPLQRPMGVHQQGAWWPYGPNNGLGNQPTLGRDWRPNYRGY